MEHYSYCPRQCGLIHLEDVFDENIFTLRGRMAHERVDQAISRTERGMRIERALPIWSAKHGLTGRADVVEFYSDGSVVPVEYKSGPSRHVVHASIQLCAQALCLEEMFDRPIPEGALFFFADRQRISVQLDEALRQDTVMIVEAVRDLMAQTYLPEPVADRRCQKCSLFDACQPHLLSDSQRETGNIFRPRPPRDLP